MLEFIKLRFEVLENFVFRIFLQYMVKKAETCNKFFCVFFCYIAGSHYTVDHCHEVMMTPEIEVVSFLYFTVYYFSYVEVI